MEKLIKLRSELSVPKNQFNSFGKYKYRSQEDILEAVKPLLEKYGLLLSISDELVNIGERYYIKATILISDGTEHVTSIGYARESLAKKGMDESQITGAASSYARKYALNAMFLIDDTKDADTDSHHEQTNKPEKKVPEFDRDKAIKAIDDEMQKVAMLMGDRDIVRRDMEKAKTRSDFMNILAQVKMYKEN